MRKAVIDMGTNTFNLLIADVKDLHFDVLYTEKIGVALGMGINQKMISKEALIRGLKAMQSFQHICSEHQVEDIVAIGTSAIRDAHNAPDFLKQIYDCTKINVKVISGKKEAQLIYQGILWSHDFCEPSVIMDIGGGSTEFIFAHNKGVSDMISLNIGILRIFQMFEFNNPLSKQDVQKIEFWLEAKSKSFFKVRQTDVLIGASGCFETFYELIHKNRFPEDGNMVELDLEALNTQLDYLIFSSLQERNKNPWIIPIRKNLAAIAAVKTKWIIKQLDVKKVLVSPYSLKEGVLKK